MVRHKEKGKRLEKKIDFKVTEGMFEYLKDFADTEGADISKILRGIVQMHMDEKAKDEYYLIDKINETIKHHENEIEKLSEMKERITPKQ